MKFNRRDFLKTSALTTGSLVIPGTLLIPGCATSKVMIPKKYSPNDQLQVLAIGVVGSIGAADLSNVASHPRTKIVGLCDIDDEYLDQASEKYPDTFRCKDYREAFDKYGDQFDAVIISTPDHMHCSMMTLALAKGKHIYGQKPLVQQLDELETLQRAVNARRSFSTQTGNQRMQIPGRRAFVDILKRNVLGKAQEAWITVNSSPAQVGFYFHGARKLDPVETPPKNIDWDLWLGCAPEMDYRPNIAHRRWRSWWEYGTGALGDWCCHLFDVLFYAYPELGSPNKVVTNTEYKVVDFHADYCRSTLTFPTTGDRFAESTFKIHYADSGLTPNRKDIPHVGEGEWPNKTITIIACEGGTLALTAGGELELWRDGKMSDGSKMDGLPEFAEFNHWHEWVNSALNGKQGENHWTPFEMGLKFTECGLLTAKAAKYPGQELHWDRGKLMFTNHDEANKTIVKRKYRKGFEPVKFAKSSA